jgi:pyruvate,orthophosphate dikinase
MKGKPVTIRLLDPPLHEFLPKEDDDIREVAKDMGMTFDNLKATVSSLHEFNPMMGHRGCRLCVTYPRSPRCRPRPSSRPPSTSAKETGEMITPRS